MIDQRFIESYIFARIEEEANRDIAMIRARALRAFQSECPNEYAYWKEKWRADGTITDWVIAARSANHSILRIRREMREAQ